MSDWFERFGYAEVADGLLTGAYPTDAQDVAALAAEGVTCVLNLCEECEYYEGERDAVAGALARAGIQEHRLETIDYGSLLPGLLEEATDTVLRWLDGGQRVYLHCRAGWQRSTAVAGAVVARREGIELEQALASIRARKPSAQALSHQIEDLHRWWRMRSVRREP